MIFVPSPPVRVTELAVEPGDEAGGAIMTVTDVVVAIDSSVPIEEAPLVKEGMEVLIDEPDLGIDETGVVSQVAETPGTDGVDGFHVYFEVTRRRRAADPRRRIRAPHRSDRVDRRPRARAFPSARLSLAPDGSSRVQRADRRRARVRQVEPGLSAGGFAEVTPIDGTLEPGDLVVVGFEGGADSGA